MSFWPGPRRAPSDLRDMPTGGRRMEVTAPFIIDALESREGSWVGRVRVDGHVLFLCAEAGSQERAVQTARSALAAHLEMLFTGATDVEHQQQTERYGSLVELEAAAVLHQAAGWALLFVRAQDGQFVAFFQRDWP